MLEARNISYSAGGRVIVSDVTAAFQPGRLSLIVGPNGAGKSTLVKLLAGFLGPKSGTIEYEGQKVSAMSEIELARRRAVLSQAVEIAFPLSVREVVMMGRYPHFGGHPGPADEGIVDEMLALFGLSEFSGRNYQTLSGGERQRVNFARVLGQLWRPPDHMPDATSTCRYLFLDEPLTFLDIRHQLDFMKKVRAFSDASDVVTVGVVHDLDLAARFADHLVLLDLGMLVAAGRPAEVLTSEKIRQVFDVEPRFVAVEGSGKHLMFD